MITAPSIRLPRWYGSLATQIVPGKVLVIFGPRRVGKTTLVRDYLDTLAAGSYLSVSGDQARSADAFSSLDEGQMMDVIGTRKLVFIDEAQLIPNIGQNLKLLIDTHPGLTIIATGSSAFELAGQTGEPLTGRKRSLQLYPLSVLEMSSTMSPAETRKAYPQWLVWGMYPEVLTAGGQEQREEVLAELINSYLYKDILALERVKSAKLLRDLLQMVAFQVGSEVSLNELAGNLGIDVKTVARYLDLFEKSFIVYNVRGFSRNLRSEITKKSKYYFHDNGVRNAVINNLNPLDRRDDIGKLWENFMFMERVKTRAYKNIMATDYFWRTWSQQEIDLIEQRGGQLYAYEFKWAANKKSAAPKTFEAAYPGAEFEVISPETARTFLL